MMSFNIKYKEIFLTSLILLLLYGCSGEDQITGVPTGTITGTVVAKGTNEKLVDVRVSTTPASSTVFTDEEGAFVINEIPEGSYSVQAVKDGYLAQFEAATIIPDGDISIVFELDLEASANNLPTTPQLISPENGSTDLPVSVELVWSSDDEDEDDVLGYSITLFNDTNDEVLLFEEITDTTFVVDNLLNSTKYFWQVAVNDGISDPVQSSVFTFETQDAATADILFVKEISGNNVIFAGNENGESIQLTSNSFSSWRPRKNLETGKIAFLRNVSGSVHLFTMDEDGSNVNQVTSTIPVNGFNFNEIDFTWKPEGDKLLYPFFDKVYSINLDGTGRTLFYETADGSLVTELSWSRFNNVIAVKTNDINGYTSQVYTINPNGVIVDIILSGVSGAAGGLDISIDGELVVYTYDISGVELPAFLPQDSRIFVYNTVTDDPADQLDTGVQEGFIDVDPMFSPNENLVIFTQKGRSDSAVKNIIAHNFTTGEMNLTELFFDASMPDWK